ncbi:EexN family lipoprotein [sulfur-oxidizing endosymbiont of Gigantopelta aegis]|uniref:EexN family lipoprotein n=1 Tax=sulfur-oxidizing endosymbiont of Gigantopelta aegis TaxID=2794934 RepID=UPI0018DDFFF8|nr:EexN family lipoprotein [sulfur-oxidizing endosymbiont of Gigantopelta aegis]
MKKIILILAISTSLAGCFEEEKKEETRTVDWFLKHEDVLFKTLDQCQNDPGELEKTPNCKNATRAYHIR